MKKVRREEKNISKGKEEGECKEKKGTKGEDEEEEEEENDKRREEGRSRRKE